MFCMFTAWLSMRRVSGVCRWRWVVVGAWVAGCANIVLYAMKGKFVFATR